MTRADRSKLPALGPDPVFAFPAIQKRQLSSGLAIWTVEHRDVPLVACLLLLPVGSAADPPGQPGLCGISADLLDESSGGLSTLEVHERLSRLGARCSVEIGFDATVVCLTALSRFTQPSLEVVAGMVARPGLEPADFTRVRDLRIHQLLQLRNSPQAIADRAFAEALYPGQPYGHLAIGTESSLQSITLNTVAQFHRRRFVPPGATLIAVGDVTHDVLAEAAEAAFESWKSEERSTETGDTGLSAAPASARAPGNRLVLVHRPRAEQSELRVGHVGTSRDTPDLHPLLVLNMALGGQFVSRVNLNLRETKGYTYGARTSFEFRRQPGPFVVQTSVQTSATADAIREVFGEIRDVRSTRPLSGEELELSKASLTRGFPRGFETAEQVARSVAQLALYGLPDDYFTCYPARIAAVSGEDVARVARQYLDPDDLVVVVVGDREAVRQPLEGLDLGSIDERAI